MTQLRNTIVNTQEADALKEMIFKRVRERAGILENNITASVTSDTRNDVMELARDSFVATKNPFNVIKERKFESVEEKEELKVEKSKQRVEELKNNIIQKNNEANESIANMQVQKAMLDARQDFSNKTSFMGALNFLNSQASISLINKRAKSFEALA